MSSDAGKKAYVVAMVIQVIYTGMYVMSKAALDGGMNSFVFIFYRQAAATLLLLPLAILLERKNAPPMSLWLFTKIFMYALLGSTVSMNLHNLSLKYTSATVASATSNSIPVITFLFAVLLHLEAIKLRASSGMAKLAGVALCVAGVLVIALYAGPPLSPLNHHRAFAGHAHANNKQGQWMKGTFLMLLANITWSLWMVLQARLLKEYPNKLLLTALQCLLSATQSLVLAAAATVGLVEAKDGRGARRRGLLRVRGHGGVLLPAGVVHREARAGVPGHVQPAGPPAHRVLLVLLPRRGRPPRQRPRRRAAGGGAQRVLGEEQGATAAALDRLLPRQR